MTRYPKKTNFSLIESIPHDLATEILSRVAASSVADISSIKLSCKRLREIAEDAHVYRHACLDKFPIVPWTPLCDKQQNFLNKCRQSANPETYYREGLLDFITKKVFDKKGFEPALQKLKAAVKLGHVGALYVSYIIYLFSGDNQGKRRGIKWIANMNKTRFSRRKLRSCRRKLMKELKQMWVMNPLMRKPPILCSTQRHQRSGKEEEAQEDCEACVAQKEVEFISSTYN